MYTMEKLIRKGRYEVKNKKVWIFVALVIAILVLNHIFGWSSYIGDPENMELLQQMLEENM